MKHPLRDYQQEDSDAVIREWEKVRSTLGVAATGLGKTRLMVDVVERRLPGRAIMLAHRRELIFQARNAFLRAGIDVSVEQGELTASTNVFSQTPVVLATVQTLSSGKTEKKRMERFNPMDFDTLLYDESHHSVSKGNKKIVDYFLNGNPNLKVLGVTATPDRGDEEALGQIFETVAFERDILFGVENGWLVEPEQLMKHIGGLDFSEMRTTAGDFNGADLSAVMEAEEPCHQVAQAILEAMFRLDENALLDVPIEQWGQFLSTKATPRRTIVFTVSVKQSEMLSNILNRVVGGLSTWVCGKTPDDERATIFRGFESGETHCLVNCGVTTEGYDNPFVELIAVARPTKSRSLYAQMIGRGTRPIPGVVDGMASKNSRLLKIALSAKPKVTILDFAGNAGRHKLVHLSDILGGRVSPEAIAAVEKIMEKKSVQANIRQLLEEEEAKIQKLREERRIKEEAKKAKLLAKVKYSTTVINPFDAFDITPAQPRAWDSSKRLSEPQQRVLMQQGIDPSKLTYTQGRQVLNEFFRRVKGGLCSMKQANIIKQKRPDVDVRNLSRDDASQMLDVLIGGRKK